MTAKLKPLIVGMGEAGVLLNCGPDKLYQLIDAGELDTFLEGQRRKITMASIERHIAGRLAERQLMLDRSAVIRKRIENQSAREHHPSRHRAGKPAA